MTATDADQPKKKPGRPKKNTDGAPWTIRGIHPDVRQLVSQAAKKENMTAGEWINVYVRELAVEKVKHNQTRAVAKLDETVIAESLSDLNEKLSETINRLTALENKPTLTERIFGKK